MNKLECLCRRLDSLLAIIASNTNHLHEHIWRPDQPMKLNISILDRGVNEQNRMSVQKIGQPKRLSLLVMPIIYTNTYLPPANEVCEGYVFTSVCPQEGSASVHAGIADPPGTRHTPLEQTPPQSRHPLARHPSAQYMLGDTANKWAVRILLECVLVTMLFCSQTPQQFLSSTVNSLMGRPCLTITPKNIFSWSFKDSGLNYLLKKFVNRPKNLSAETANSTSDLHHNYLLMPHCWLLVPRYLTLGNPSSLPFNNQ